MQIFVEQRAFSAVDLQARVLDWREHGPGNHGPGNHALICPLSKKLLICFSRCSAWLALVAGLQSAHLQSVISRCAKVLNTSSPFPEAGLFKFLQFKHSRGDLMLTKKLHSLKANDKLLMQTSKSLLKLPSKWLYNDLLSRIKLHLTYPPSP